MLRRLASMPRGAARGPTEQSCFAQLAALLDLLNTRREWSQFAPLLELASAAGFGMPAHQTQLRYYRGLLAVRSQRYRQGIRLLTRLTDADGVAVRLRMLAWNSIGVARWGQSQYDEALHCFQQVHLLAMAAGEHEYEGLALLNISIVRNETGDYERALGLAQQALAIFRARGFAHREAHALYEIGNTELQLGRWRAAAASFAQSAARYRELGASYGLAAIYWAQGFLHHILGAAAASEAAYGEALALAQSEQHHDPAIVMDIHTYLGLLHQSAGRPGPALAAYRAALAAGARVRNRHAVVLITYRIGTVLEQLGRLRAAAAAYRRAVALLEKLRGSLNSLELKIGLLGTTAQIFEATVRLHLRQGAVAEAFDYVERARSRAFLDMLARRSPSSARPRDRPTISAGEVQAALPAGATLVEYFTMGVMPHEERLSTSSRPRTTPCARCWRMRRRC